MRSLFSLALSEGLSEHLTPTAIALLECTSTELKATIDSCKLWQTITIRREGSMDCHWWQKAPAFLKCVIDRKGVQQVFLGDDEIDLPFIKDLMELQSATSRQLMFAGRVSRVAIGCISLVDDHPANVYDNFPDFAVFNIKTNTFTPQSIAALEFVGRHFPDALVVFEGFCDGRCPWPQLIDVDELAVNTLLRALMRAIDATLRSCGLKRVRVGLYNDIVRHSYGHDWSIAPFCKPDDWEEQQRQQELLRAEELEGTFYECTSGTCKCLSDVAHPSGRHFHTYIGGLSETVEEWFNHTWQEWFIGEGCPPDHPATDVGSARHFNWV